MDSSDLIRWYLSNRNMGSLVPSTGRAVGSPGGTALVPSGRGLQRTYGEFSEVPPELGGPSQPRIGYTHNGEVQPPPRETFGKPATRMGPLIEGELASGAEHNLVRRVIGMLGSRAAAGTLAAGGEAALGPMGAVIAAGNGRGGNSMADMQGLADAYKEARTNANNQVARRFGAMQPPSPMTPNQQVADRFGAMQPPAQSSGGLPGWLTGADYSLGHSGGFATGADEAQNAHIPMPQARPPQAAMAQAPAPQQAPQQPMGFFARNAAMMRDPATGELIDPQGAARAQQQDQGGLIQKMLGMLNNRAG